MGAKVRLNHALGRDIDINTLKNDFDAVFLAIGRTISRKLPKTRGIKQIIDAIAFLENPGKFAIDGAEVGVIGGGNTAMDTARLAKRAGAKVTVFYRRDHDAMPALAEEVLAAEKEGIGFEFLASPMEFAELNNRATVLFQRMRLQGTDSDGRPVPVPEEDDVFGRNMDLCMVAIGEYSAAGTVLKDTDIELDESGSIRVDPTTMMTSIAGIFAGGDGADGQGTVIHAVRDGKAAAASIDAYLTGGKAEVPLQYMPVKVEKTFKPSRYTPTGRVIETDPIKWEGIVIPEGWTKDDFREKAKEEAARCIQCGTCANCTACIEKTGCPAIIMGPRGPEILEDQCVGCGLCALVCPNDAIETYRLD